MSSRWHAFVISSASLTFICVVTGTTAQVCIWRVARPVITHAAVSQRDEQVFGRAIASPSVTHVAVSKCKQCRSFSYSCSSKSVNFCRATRWRNNNFRDVWNVLWMKTEDEKGLESTGVVLKAKLQRSSSRKMPQMGTIFENKFSTSHECFTHKSVKMC